MFGMRPNSRKSRVLKTVLVTNGCASIRVLEEILPYIDAMNIDLKGFSEGYFHYVGGDFAMTKISSAWRPKHCHVELTTLVVPRP
jgi:pyruvate formate lyase activating enzyme